MKQRHQDCEQSQMDWDASQGSGSVSRRSFLLSSGAALTAATVTVALPSALAKNAEQASTRPGFTPKQRIILTALTEHLFPKGSDSPGATDINAVVYLESAIFRPGYSSKTRKFMLDRVQTLHEASMERFDLAFQALEFSHRETLLRYLVDRTRWGTRWISSLLSYILEALLADPVYGGNPDGVGWKWLEHQPGFPTPPPNKTYMRILANL